MYGALPIGCRMQTCTNIPWHLQCVGPCCDQLTCMLRREPWYSTHDQAERRNPTTLSGERLYSHRSDSKSHPQLAIVRFCEPWFEKNSLSIYRIFRLSAPPLYSKCLARSFDYQCRWLAHFDKRMPPRRSPEPWLCVLRSRTRWSSANRGMETKRLDLSESYRTNMDIDTSASFQYDIAWKYDSVQQYDSAQLYKYTRTLPHQSCKPQVLTTPQLYCLNTPLQARKTRLLSSHRPNPPTQPNTRLSQWVSLLPITRMQ
jgi:hypothetical protein